MYSVTTTLVRSVFGAVSGSGVVVGSILRLPSNTWVPSEPTGDGRSRARITHNGVPLDEMAKSKKVA